MAAAPASAELVAWYPLDEAPGAAETVTEAVAGNGGTLIGFDPDPAFSFVARGNPSARPGLGTSYLITKGGGLELGDDPAVQPTDKFTISFWFQPLPGGDAFDRFFESQVTNTNAQDGIRIDTGSGGRVRVLVRDGGNANTQFTHPIDLTDGNWYFFAFRYDSAGVDNPPFRITVVEAAGDPVDEAAIAAATGGPGVVNTGPIHFPHATGALIGVENAAATGGNNLHAAIDELAFFDNSDGDGVLSDQQLADIYNFGPSGVKLINDFSSDLASISPGNPATLSWEVAEPFDTLTLDDGEGTITDLAPLTSAGAGTIAVTPAETTTYWLRATRGGAANVSTLRILAGAAPDIGSFSASAAIIQVGGSVDLSWAVTGADSLVLDPGGTDVSALQSIVVSPDGTTTYTLSATNAFGTSTADVTVIAITGPVPAHRYIASSAGNDGSRWTDEVGGRNWGLTGALYDAPLILPSPNTNIAAAYTAGGNSIGGSVGSFQLPDFTAEIWLRRGAPGPDHEVIFETGGGQNGLAALLNEDGFRFIGSIGDMRTLDLTVPLAGLNLDDFIQLVFSTSADTDAFEVSVRDTFGNVLTASESADILIGGNGAGLFVWASGALGGSENNLGGRTEAADASPPGLTGFAGEIGIVNIYDRILGAADIQLAFDAVGTVVDPPAEVLFAITQVERDPVGNTLTVTWNAVAGRTYDAQFSTDLQDWFDLDGPFVAAGDQATETLNFPPSQGRFFVRIRELEGE